METWKHILTEAMIGNGETLADIVSNTMTDAEMDVEFDDGYGNAAGIPFTVWTANNVYFPVVYDGAEWVGSVSRNPDGFPTEHQGGQ
jgi:hypothetical protein